MPYRSISLFAASLMLPALAMASPAVTGDAPAAPMARKDTAAARFVDRTKGVYLHYEHLREADGAYDAENIMEIAPYGRTEAYIRMRTTHGNYHSCSLYGIFKAESDAYVYERSDPDPKGLSCRMRITLKGSSFETSVVNTKTGESLQECIGGCGARGSFDNDRNFALRQRRPIRYMTRLLDSQEYRAAVAHRQGLIAWPSVNHLPIQDKQAPQPNP